MNPAIDFYHSLLTPDIAEASHVMLEEQLRARGLIFGERALATVLRPRLMSPEQLAPARTPGCRDYPSLPQGR